MLGHNADLDHLEDGQGERNPPEYSPRSLHCRHVDVLVVEDVDQHLDYQAHEEEHVCDDVVVVPEGEVSFLEPSCIRFGALEAIEKEGSPDVPEAVGGDEDGEEPVDPVDVGDGGLCDVAEDEADEADVGEGGIEGPVQRHLPLLAEPGR